MQKENLPPPPLANLDTTTSAASHPSRLSLAPPPARRQRLVLDRIELENFKSYAGKVIVGPFHEHFSAIIGPNGSGKSNIIDAMQFVFGRRAAQLRQKKAADLIHTSQHLKPKSAKVSVYMSRIAEEWAMTSSGESRSRLLERRVAFCVSREVNSDGSSRYTIDGRNVQHAEVVSYLKGQDIDLEHNRFLILQGEVEQLAMMAPKGKKPGDNGFLEVLEDLIGSNQYIEMIDACDATAEEQRGAVDEAQRKYALAKAEMDQLAGPCQLAAGFVRCQKKVMAAKARQAARKVWGLRNDIKKLEEKLIDAERALAEHRDQRADQELAFKNLQNEVLAAEKELKALQGEKEKTTKALKNCEVEDSSLDGRLKNLAARRSKALASIDELEVEAHKLETEAEQILVEADARRKELPTLQTQLEKARQETQKLNDKLAKEYAALTEEQAPVDAHLQSLREEGFNISAQISHAESEANEVRRRLNESGEQATALKAKLTLRDKEIRELESSSEALKQELSMKELDLKETNARMNEARNTEEVKRKQKSDLEVEVSRKAQGHPPASCRMLRHLRRCFSGTGHLRNVGEFLLDTLEGHLEDEALKKYGPALSAAGLGSDPVLVPNEKCAKAVLDYVREKQLGRVECLVRGRIIKANRDKALKFKLRLRTSGSKLPPRCTAALDLLNLPEEDEDLWILFYARLAETFVTESSDPSEVRELSENNGERCRVVTLGGQVYERSGVVSGGVATNYLEQRRLEPDGSSDALHNHRTLLEQMEAEIRNAAATKREATSHCTNLAEGIRLLNRKQQQQVEELHSLRQLQQEQRKQLDLLLGRTVDSAQVAADQTALQTLEKKLLKLQDRALHIQSKIALEEKKREKIQQKIAEVGGPGRKALAERLSKLEEDFKHARDITNNGIVKSQAAKEKASSILSKLIPDKKTEIEGMDKEAAETRRRVEELEARAVELLKGAEGLDAALDKAQCSISEKKELRSELESELRAQGSAEMELRARVDEHRAALTKTKHSVSEQEKQLEDLRSDFERMPVIDSELQDSLAGQGLLPTGDTSQEAVNELIKCESVAAATLVRVKREIQDDGEEEENEILMETPNASSKHKDLMAKVMDVPWPNLGEDAVSAITQGELDLELYQAEELVSKFGSAKGKGDDVLMDLSVLQRFQAKSTVFREARHVLENQTKVFEDLCEQAKNLRAKRRSEFQDGFLVISEKVKEIYQMLTLGGDAELEWKDPSDPFTEGIEFSVRPPGKSWRVIQNLSGGEKTLSSLALIFALHHYRPTPIYFLDEIDAALDPNNVVIIASYVAAARTEGAQFVVISLRHQFFERADRLIGVCKVSNLTQTCTVDPDAFCAVKVVQEEAQTKKRRLPVENPIAFQ